MNAEALFLILVLALLGGIGGGAAVLGADAVARRFARWRGIPVPRRANTDSGTGGGGDLESIRAELSSLRTAMNGVLQQVSGLSRALGPDPLATTGELSLAARPLNPDVDDPLRREPIGRRLAGPEGSAGADPPYRPFPAPTRGLAGWSQGPGAGAAGPGTGYPLPPLPGDPWENPAQVNWLGEIDARASDQIPADSLDRSTASAFDRPQADPFDPPGLLTPTSRELPLDPVAPHASAGPPPNAVNVEARDDRIVASTSYPPEAWLEPRGPAVAHLWLNPSVALNENALRRLSTFFQWQGERAGATYDTDTPAVLRWDEGQRVGTLTRRGTARPR
jgi:hypothetical protein